MIDYVISEYCKKYLKENNIELDDKIKYTLIIDRIRNYSLSEVMESIKELAESTSDEEIKEQAPIWLKNRQYELDKFTRDSGPEYCYVVSYQNSHHEKEIQGYYRNLDLAVKVGIAISKEENLSRFNISKEHIISNEKDDEFLGEEPFDEEDVGDADYTADGKMTILRVYSSLEENIEDPIEDRYYDLPHPFKVGDVVKDINDNNNDYIVLSGFSDSKKYLWTSWDDVTAYGYMFDLEAGLEWDLDDQVLPYDLEYYPVEYVHGDIRQSLLYYASKLVKGEPSFFQYIENALMKIREEHNNKYTTDLITGITLKNSSLGYWRN